MIEITQLAAGSIIEQSEIEAVTGTRRNSDPVKYQFLLMQLASQVGRELEKDGRTLTVATRDGAIHVLTHEEASKYNATKFDNAIGKMRRCHKRLLAVDITGFDAPTKENHDRNIIKTSRVLQAIRASRRNRKLEVEPTKRNTPIIARAEEAAT